MNYPASMSFGTRLITASVAVLFLAVIGLNLFVLPKENDTWVAGIRWGTSFLLVGIFAYCYFYRITGYVVDRAQITIQRPAGEKHIALDDVVNVILPEKSSLRWSIRTFGNGGIFGYTGNFANSTYGSMSWYATRIDKAILVVTRDNRKILLTPDDLQMAEEIKKRIHRSS